MKFNFSNALSSLAALIGVGTLALACSQVPTTSTDEANVGSDEAALTADQCDYFDVNGSIQICHALGNGKFKMLRTNVQGCINGHSGHGTDFVTSTNPSSPIYDPTCGGNGCLPESAPCDATLPCCDGSTCTNGTCVANVVTCPCDGVWNNYLANGVPNPFTSSCTFGPNGANAAYSTASDYGSLGTFTLGGQKTCSVFGTDTTVVRYTRSLSDSEFQACSAVVSAWMTAGGLTSGDCN
jgi:hypothetical protein